MKITLLIHKMLTDLVVWECWLPGAWPGCWCGGGALCPSGPPAPGGCGHCRQHAGTSAVEVNYELSLCFSLAQPCCHEKACCFLSIALKGCLTSSTARPPWYTRFWNLDPTLSNTACMSAVWRGWPHLDLREYMSWSVRWWVTLKRQPPSWCRGQRSPHVQRPEARPSSSLKQYTSYYMTSES